MIIQPIARGAHSQFDTGDCAVRAFANAGEITYSTAHELLREVGRKNHEGATHQQCFEVFLKNGFELASVYGYTTAARSASVTLRDYVDNVPVSSGTTLKNFIKDHPIGSYIMVMRGHAFALVDGDIIDSGGISENVRICIAFKKIDV